MSTNPWWATPGPLTPPFTIGPGGVLIPGGQAKGSTSPPPPLPPPPSTLTPLKPVGSDASGTTNLTLDEEDDAARAERRGSDLSGCFLGVDDGGNSGSGSREGGGGGISRNSSAAELLTIPDHHRPSSRRSSANLGNKSAAGSGGGTKKKERWLVTRKTWRYMADAGKLLIPEALRKGKDMKDYSAEEIEQLDDHYQKVCDRLAEFVIWEGPLEDPRILLARNRIESGADLIASALGFQQQQQQQQQHEFASAEEIEKDKSEGKKKKRQQGNKVKGKDTSSSTATSGKLVGRKSGAAATAAEASELAQLREEHAAAVVKAAAAGSSASILAHGHHQPRSLRAPQQYPPIIEHGSQMPVLRSTPGHSVPASGRKGSSSNRRRPTSTARMTSFGGFGPGGASSGSAGAAYRSGHASSTHFSDTRLGKADGGGRGGFFPSPYGTGMLPTAGFGGIPDFRNDPGFSSRLRIMLPIGEQPPEGFDEVEHRSLPLDELDNLAASSSSASNNNNNSKSGGGGGGVNNDPSSYLQLPSGMLLQELPPAFTNEADRDWFSRRSSSAQDSGVLSPTSPDEFGGLMFHDDDSFIPEEEEELDIRHNESGIGSGADSVGTASVTRSSVTIQTEPLPKELLDLQEEVKRKKEEEERRRLALIAEEEERKRLEQEDMDSTVVGDSVMRYLKMVRRNSKAADHKKADRFRSMNYDPTLRNIKAKYLVSEDHIEGMKHVEVQAGENLVPLLKRCETPIDPTPDRMFSAGGRPPGGGTPGGGVDCSGDSFDTMRRLSMALPEEPLAPLTASERDFFSHLYSGSLSALNNEQQQHHHHLQQQQQNAEDYYHYLESWYRAQKSLLGGSHSGSHYFPRPPSLSSTTSTTMASNSSSSSTSFPFNIPRSGFPAQPGHHHHQQQQQQQQQHLHHQQHQQYNSQSQSQQQQQQQHTGIYIPVSVLQNLRQQSSAAVTTTAASTPTVSRSNSTTGGKSQSFLSSVISSAKPFAGLGSANQQQTLSSSNSSNLNFVGGGGSSSHQQQLQQQQSTVSNNSNVAAVSTPQTAALSLTKKLWRPRSKSQSRPSVCGSSWTPQVSKLQYSICVIFVYGH